MLQAKFHIPEDESLMVPPATLQTINIYIYIYTYIYIYIYLFIYLCICIYLVLSLSLSLYIYIYIYIYVEYTISYYVITYYITSLHYIILYYVVQILYYIPHGPARDAADTRSLARGANLTNRPISLLRVWISEGLTQADS